MKKTSYKWDATVASTSTECFALQALDDIVAVLHAPPAWLTRTIKQVAARSAICVQNTLADCHVAGDQFGRSTRHLDRRFTPKTLVCHDYKGGYLEDRYLSAVNVGNGYSFYNWAHIDVFVYFSHNLVTIPPLCWINAAHKNGVKILGTFITESDHGQHICEQLLKDATTMRFYATHLARLATIFGFDGWLLNIENVVTAPNTVAILKDFVECLTRASHADNPDSLVIWYDSVTDDGQLNWQNELNNRNKCFFDRCDGIFLNYVWTEANVVQSQQLAQHRALDVYVGIDVFGRNTFGGGEFNTFKAAQIIRRHNLSMAIFAPGWTHETLPREATTQQSDDEDDNNNNITMLSNFLNRDCAFWNSLWPYLYTHPITDFFSTNFSIGITENNYDMFSQQLQLSRIKHPSNSCKILDLLVPDYDKIPPLFNKCQCIQLLSLSPNVGIINNNNSLIHGCRVIKSSLLSKNRQYIIHRLFTCDIRLNRDVIVYFTSNNNNAISLNLLITNDYGNFKVIKCVSAKKNENLTEITGENNTSSSIIEINPLPEDNSLLSSILVTGHQHAKISAYKISASPCILLEIGCSLENDVSTAVLYSFGIKEIDD